jgi:hypothetical protein
MGNQNPYIEEQTTQWQKEKIQKNIQRNTKRTHKSKNRVIRTQLKTNDQGYVPLVINTSRSFPHSWVITGFVTRLTRRIPLVEQELPTFPEHLSSPPDLSGIPFIRSLVLWVCFVNRCLSFFSFSFWPLCCLYFFDLRILITPLVSWNSSYDILYCLQLHGR